MGINAAPADFVVHEGQAFRVVRTSFDAGAAGRLTPTEGVLLDGGGGSVDELVPSLSSSPSSSSMPSLAARRRAASLEKSRALPTVQVSATAEPTPTSTVTPTEEGVTAMNASFSAPAVMQHGHQQSDITSSSSKEREGKSPARSPPRGLAARLAMGSQERRKLALQRREAHAATTAAAAAASGATIDPPSSSARPSGPNSVEALRARTRSDSQSSHSPATSARTDASDPPDSADGPYDSSPQSTMSKSFSGPLWTWKDPYGASPLLLFIAHDNPQVGNTVAAQLKTHEGMKLMVESKDEGGGSLTCILLATIAYSGPCEGVEGASIQAQRGSQFIVCSDLTGYRADIKVHTAPGPTPPPSPPPSHKPSQHHHNIHPLPPPSHGPITRARRHTPRGPVATSRRLTLAAWTRRAASTSPTTTRASRPSSAPARAASTLSSTPRTRAAGTPTGRAAARWRRSSAPGASDTFVSGTT